MSSTSFVKFDTNFGSFTVELFASSAPITVANFLSYVNQGSYTASFFHRLVAGFVLQGGGFTYTTAANAIATKPAIQNEYSATRPNVVGTIAMAKVGTDPNSATDQFFFNLADNSANLDSQNGGFTVFGEVVQNWSIVQTIAALPTVNAGSPFDQLPVQNYVSGPITGANLVIVNDIQLVTPAIANTQANQQAADTLPASPFAGVTLPTIGYLTAQGDQLTIAIDNAAGAPTAALGTLSLPQALATDGLTLTATSPGTYLLASTDPAYAVALLQAALQSLVFTPSRLAPGVQSALVTFDTTLDIGGVGQGTVESKGASLVLRHTANDFNGDGRSDLLLQDDNGAIVLETQASLTVTAGYLVAQPGPSWHVIGTGDFNGDGQTDLLLQNTSGTVVDYLMNGTGYAAGYVLGAPGAAWHVRGTGDFNGDGKSDIVLQHDDGTMVVWTTDGATVTGGAVLGNPGPGWTIQGVADFNGDGRPDILLQNTNGSLVDYLLDGTAIASGALLGNPGAGWSVAGTGDYNSDGRADILLHNDNGADVVWNTNGTSVVSATLVADPGPTYTGAVAGLDLNGDGSPDLLLQNSTSSLIGYTLDANAGYTGGAVVTTPGLGWHAIGNDPVTFIDGTGASYVLNATAGVDQFDYTSFLTGYHQVTGFDPALDSIALGVGQFPSYAAVRAAELPYQGGTYIGLGPTTSLVLHGVDPSQLTASNFVLR